MAKKQDENKSEKILVRLWETLCSPKSKIKVYDNYRNTAYLSLVLALLATSVIMLILNMITLNNNNNEQIKMALIPQNNFLWVVIIFSVIAIWFIDKQFKQLNRIPTTAGRTYSYTPINKNSREYVFSEFKNEFEKSTILNLMENGKKVYKLDKDNVGWKKGQSEVGTIDLIHKDSGEIIFTIFSGDITIQYPPNDIGEQTLKKIHEFLNDLVKNKKIFSKITIIKDDAKDI